MLAVPPEFARRYEARLVRQNMVTGQRMHDHITWTSGASIASRRRLAGVYPLFRTLAFYSAWMIHLGNRLFHPLHVLRFRLEQAAHVVANRGLDGPGALAEATAEAVAEVREPPTDSGPQPHPGVHHRVFLTLPATPFMRQPPQALSVDPGWVIFNMLIKTTT